jgi:hypothetical protein
VEQRRYGVPDLETDVPAVRSRENQERTNFNDEDFVAGKAVGHARLSIVSSHLESRVGSEQESIEPQTMPVKENL